MSSNGDGWPESVLLVSDSPHGPVSRMVDRIETVQLGLAERVLDRARKAGVDGGQLGHLVTQLAEALADALVIAQGRGARLGEAGAGFRDTLSLPGADLASAGVARSHVRHLVQGLAQPLVDDMESITGELVANALEHTDSRTVTVVCALTPRALSVSVTDEGDGVPVRLAVDVDRERGRGLLITDALATRWGTCRTADGLTTWAEIGLAP